jgi:hypothetical protein
MISQVRHRPQQWPAFEVRGQPRQVAFIVCAYTAVYIALDWISLVQALPTGFTLWNPPPAASLALLIFRFLSGNCGYGRVAEW